MNHAGTFSTAALAAMLACACRSQGAGPVDARLPAAQRDDGWAVVCVVDARSGRPIEGATIAAVPESDAPLPRTWWQARASESDADGIARLDLSDLTETPWLLVRADGYAPHMVLTRDPGPRIELEPAVDLEVEVRDAFERPVEGALASWYAGCGHTPDLAFAATDAAGRAWLEGIASDASAGDLWVAGSAIHSDVAYAPDQGLALVRAAPGVAARGRVVDADGQALAGVFVGAPRMHHGPWTATDRDGAFELPALDLPLEVQVLREADSESLLGAFDLPSDGRPVTISAAPDDGGARTAVELRLRARASLEAVEGVEVEFVRLDDGRTQRRRSDGEGLVALELPHGAWQWRLGGGFSGWSPVERRQRLGDEPLRETVSLELQPRWRFRLMESHPEARIELASEVELRELDAEELAGAPVPMPREGRCAVRVLLHDRVRVLLLESVARRADGEFALELPAPLQVRARLVGPDGAPARGALWVGVGDPPARPDAEAATEAPSVRTRHAAPAHLWVLPEDKAFAPRRLARVLPWEDLELDLGTVALESAGSRRVTLVDASGAPLVGAEVAHWSSLGRHAPVLDAAGAFESAAFPAAEGDALAVRPAGGGPTFHAALSGGGPWTVAQPDTHAVFEVSGTDGAPLAHFEVVVEGQAFAGSGGRLELRGLDPNVRAAFVSAAGHRSWRQPIELAPGAEASWSVALAPATP